MHIKSKVWSNAFFLVPLLFSLYFGLYVYSILLFLAIIFSTVYHLSNEKKFEFIDQVFAYVIIAYNLYLCYLSDFKQPYFTFAVLFVAIGVYFLYIKKKDDYEWHLSCAMISLCCILAYVM